MKRLIFVIFGLILATGCQGWFIAAERVAEEVAEDAAVDAIEKTVEEVEKGEGVPAQPPADSKK